MASFANYAAMKLQVSRAQILSLIKVTTFSHLIDMVQDTEEAQDLMCSIKMSDLVIGGVCDIYIKNEYHTLSVWNLVNEKLGGIR